MKPDKKAPLGRRRSPRKPRRAVCLTCNGKACAGKCKLKH